MYFNKLNGMGTKAENKRLRTEREATRKENELEKIKIWDIWKKYSISDLDEEELDKKEDMIEKIKQTLERKMKK